EVTLHGDLGARGDRGDLWIEVEADLGPVRDQLRVQVRRVRQQAALEVDRTSADRGRHGGQRDAEIARRGGLGDLGWGLVAGQRRAVDEGEVRRVRQRPFTDTVGVRAPPA